MVSGGNATVFVSDMDRSIRFYTGVLGLTLTNRFGNNWATVQAGETLVIGLHPASPEQPAPGTIGAITLGLEIDLPIEGAVSQLLAAGASLKGTITRGQAGNFATFADPDGNEFYLWEVDRKVVPEPELVTSA